MAISISRGCIWFGVVFMLLGGVPASRAADDEKTTGGASMEVIDLPSPKLDGGVSVEKALANRRSVREYTSAPLTIAEVSQLLWSAQGVTSRDGKRTAPSAGATYPLEIYLAAGDVTGLPAGFYKYLPRGHKLQRVSDTDFRALLSGGAYGQQSVSMAPVDILITAIFQRTAARYRQAGTAFVQMEVGHAAENVYLQAESLNLGTVIVGAINAPRIKTTLSLPANEEPQAILPVGRK